MAEQDKRTALVGPVTDMMEQAWREPGFCVPNPTTYPHQWLWDSCFHSLIWLALDDDRALVELRHVMANQDPETGFVPHMTYWSDPTESEAFWGSRATSSITQPPMFGHTAAVLQAAGCTLEPALSEAVANGLNHLLVDRPRTPDGLVPVFHPWETGCDDSARWDAFLAPDRSWQEMKADFVADIAAGGGLAAGRPGPVPERQADPFVVGSIGFNALLSWNTRQGQQSSAQQGSELAETAEALVETVAGRWDEQAGTWIDDGPSSGRARTLDAMLALLVDPRDEAFDQLIDADAYGGACGPSGVHRGEPSYDPTTYWRGPAWPQLTYLLWCAAVDAGRVDVSGRLAANLVDGARASGLAEYWHPDSGAGLGARPQSWAGLALVVAGPA